MAEGNNTNANLNLPMLLASIGKAVSPQGSWQQNLGGAAEGMISEEQDRRFLSGLLSGGDMPQIRNMPGLDPNLVLQGVRTKAAITPEPQESLVQVETPFGIQQVPQSQAAEYKRKVWAEQAGPETSSIRTFRSFQNMDAETQQAFLEFSKNQRGKSFEETLAEFLAKQEAAQRQRHKVEQQLELGSADHLSEIQKNLDPAEISKARSRWQKQGREIPYETAREIFAIESAAKEMTDSLERFSKVIYRKNGEKGPGFYGITKDGKRQLVREYRPKSQ